MATNIIYMSYGDKLLVIATASKSRTKALAKIFIKHICKTKGYDPSKTDFYMHDARTIADIQHRCTMGTLERHTTENGYTYMTIESKDNNESMHFPMDDFLDDVIILDWKH